MKCDIEYLKEVVLQEIPVKPCGKHHKDIAFNTGLSCRDVRIVIQKLRDDGYPICGTPQDGYWIARYSGELNITIKTLQNHCDSAMTTMNALREAQKQLQKQEALDNGY